MIDPTLHTAACAAIEKTVNGALQYDPGSKYALARLTGQVLAIELTQPTATFFCVPTEDGVNIQGVFEGEVTTRIKGSPLALAALARGDQMNLAETGVEVFGSTGLLIELQKIAKSLEIDWEQALSDVVGDVAGHQVANTIRGAFGWLSERKQNFERLLGEYATEELRAVPSAAELNRFYRDVDQIHLATDRITARVDALKSKLTEQTNKE